MQSQGVSHSSPHCSHPMVVMLYSDGPWLHRQVKQQWIKLETQGPAPPSPPICFSKLAILEWPATTRLMEPHDIHGTCMHTPNLGPRNLRYHREREIRRQFGDPSGSACPHVLRILRTMEATNPSPATPGGAKLHASGFCMFLS